MDEKEFLKFIRACRRKLHLADFLQKAVSALALGAGAGIVLQAAAFVMPLYWADLFAGLALLLAFFAAAAAAFARRSTMEQAALAIDRFGFAERMVTAYGNLGREGEMVRLQRRDAMEKLREHKGRVRIPMCPSRRSIATLFCLCAVLLGLILMPSPVKERARMLHKMREAAQEKEAEIEEAIAELEKLNALDSAAEALTPEQQAALQEMVESLQSSLSEYRQIDSEKKLEAALEKLNYKYGAISSRLLAEADSLAGNSQASAADSPAAASGGTQASEARAAAMRKAAEKLRERSGAQLAQGENDRGNGRDGQRGDGQNGQSGNGQGGSGQSGQDGSGQGGNGQNGSSQGGQSGNGQDGSGQGGQSGNGQDGSGQGSNGGSGQGGQGGNGQGGQGRGTGSSNASHDYVSVPNAIADSGSLAGNAIDHDNSEYARTQNGLAWEGERVSYEAVIGNYERNAYEGLASGRYPSGMEEIIKEYFSSFH